VAGTDFYIIRIRGGLARSLSSTAKGYGSSSNIAGRVQCFEWDSGGRPTRGRTFCVFLIFWRDTSLLCFFFVFVGSFFFFFTGFFFSRGQDVALRGRPVVLGKGSLVKKPTTFLAQPVQRRRGKPYPSRLRAVVDPEDIFGKVGGTSVRFLGIEICNLVSRVGPFRERARFSTSARGTADSH